MGGAVGKLFSVAAFVGIGALTGGISLATGAGLFAGLSGASLFAAYVGVGVAASFALETLAKPSSPSFGSRNYRNTVRLPIVARRWIYGRARTGGALVYIQDYISRKTNLTLGGRKQQEGVFAVFVLSEGEIDAIEKMWVAGADVPFNVSDDVLTPAVNTLEGLGELRIARRGDCIRAYIHRGQESGSPLQKRWDEVAKATAPAIFGRPSYLNALQGVSAIAIELAQYGEKSNVPWTNVPSFEFLVKGMRITWPGQEKPVWTENAAACRYHYMVEAKGVSADYVDSDSVMSAYGVCQEAVEGSGGVDELRYSINGVIGDDDDFDSVIRHMDVAWSGTAPELNGRIWFRPGAPRAARATITEEMLVAGDPPAWHIELPVTDQADAIDATIRSEADHGYLPYSMPRLGSNEPDAVVQDIGEFLFVIYRATAARLMEFILAHRQAQVRTQLILTSGDNMERYALEATDYVTLNFPREGIENKRFFLDRVEKHFNGTLTVDCVEEPTDIYDDTFTEIPRRSRGRAITASLPLPTDVVAEVKPAQGEAGRLDVFVTSNESVDGTDLQVRYKVTGLG